MAEFFVVKCFSWSILDASEIDGLIPIASLGAWLLPVPTTEFHGCLSSISLQYNCSASVEALSMMKMLREKELEERNSIFVLCVVAVKIESC